VAAVTASATRYVPYCIDVNVVLLHFPDSLPPLVRSRTQGVNQLDARSLCADMSQPGEPSYDDADMHMLEMIHNGGGGYEDGKVDGSEPDGHAQPGTGMYAQPGTDAQSGTYTLQPDLYTRQPEQDDDNELDPGDGSADPKKRGREESFNVMEDELLCYAWLATSIDLIHGTEQKGTTFWANIHIWLHEHNNFGPCCNELIHNHGIKSLNH
jgi:hypothetical protein